MKFSFKSFVIGFACAALSLGAVTYANAAGNGTLKACANKTTGVMRYISKGSCKKTETSLSWNQMGPSGLPGSAGTNGTTGAKGDTGAAGAKGDTGTAGASSPTGFTARSVCGENGTTLCAVGVQGPSGGTIFYVDSTNEIAGYDYLEAAPADALFVSGVWGAWSTSTLRCGASADVNCQINFINNPSSAMGYQALGTGRAATAEIVARHDAGSVRKTEYAAGAANAYTTPAASDWWLPSKDELIILGQFARDTPRDGFARFATAYYWSSSEVTANYAWMLFSDPYYSQTYPKDGMGYVRPVRGF